MKINKTVLSVAVTLVIIVGIVIWAVRYNSHPKEATAGSELQMASIADTLLKPIVNTTLGEVKIDTGALSASGDMDGDGAPDIATVLSEAGSRGENFVSVVVFKNDNGSPRYVDAFFLGDRDNVQSLEIKDGVLSVKFLSHKANDDLAEPTEENTLDLKLENDSLVAL